MIEPLAMDRVTTAMDGLGIPERPRSNRIRVKVPLARLRDAIPIAQSRLACDHLVQISAVDLLKAFELTYHLTGEHRTVLSIAVEVSRDRPEAPSVSDLLPPAGIYERQIHDLFGIVFVGHPDLRRVILTEEWPADEFPLRKDWKPDPKKAYGGAPKGVG